MIIKNSSTKWMGLIVILILVPGLAFFFSERPVFAYEGSKYQILFIMDDNWGDNCESIIERFESYQWNVETCAMKPIITGCSYVGYSNFTVDHLLPTIVDLNQYDCISILPGETHDNLDSSSEFITLIQTAVNRSIIVAAWCRAVRLLAKADVIRGKNITGYSLFTEEYMAAGANFIPDSPPIRDGNIITSVRSNFYQSEMCELMRSTVELCHPDLLSFSTYFGGTGDEKGVTQRLRYLGGVALDSLGNIIVIGRTLSTDFPIQNAIQESKRGDLDITISKFYPNGSLIFSTYFGGLNAEWATDVAIDSKDNIVFAGITYSEDFPLVSPFQNEIKGPRGLADVSNDIFITKLSADGSTILFSTFFGGTSGDWCYAMTLNSNDSIAITGTTYSGDLPSLNAYRNSSAGGLDIFLTLFDANCTEILFSTYLGGTGNDAGRGIDFDGDLVTISGEISYSSLATENAVQFTYKGGTSDAYIAQFKENGTLVYFTYLGGSGTDRANGLIIDTSHNIYLTGYTQSTDLNIKNAIQPISGGSTDIFVGKLTTESFEFMTYLGGKSTDEGINIALDTKGNPILIGTTKSPNFYNTTVDPKLGFTTNSENIFIIQMNATGTNLSFATVLGGNQIDVPVDVISDENDNQIILGYTYSSDFPTYHAIQPQYGGDCDFFLMKMSLYNIHPYIAPSTTTNSTNESSTSPNSQQIMAFPLISLLSIAILAIVSRIRVYASHK